MKVQLRHVFIGLYAERFSQLIIVIIMAGVTGLEPATYRVTGDRSNQLSYTPLKIFGGQERTRTFDPLGVNEMLYQLS